MSPARHHARLGRYLEEFTVGDIYERFPGRTITEADNIPFSLLTMNQHPMHDVGGKAIANLGWTDVRLTAPVHPGDTIYAESEVLEVRRSKPRPTPGIATVRTTGKRADGTVFMSFVRSVLMPMRGHGVQDIA